MHRFGLHALALVVLVFGLVFGPGCLFGLPPPNHLHGGETLYIAEDSQVLQVMGPGLHKEDQRRHSHGAPVPVLPKGATVHVAADYEQQRALNAPNASMADRNPWILVEVVDSPVAAQRGWKGWIHLGTTKPQPVPAALGTWPLPRPSRLCPDVDSNEVVCTVNLDAESSVRVLGCAGSKVEVELWAQDGLYVHGFINASQFSENFCTPDLTAE